MAKHEIGTDEIRWHSDLTFYATITGLHMWGFPTVKDITEENIDRLAECLSLADLDGVCLFLCREIGHPPAKWYLPNISTENLKYFENVKDSQST